MGIQASSRADETAMILVSDHGFNAEDKVYSQGFNLVRLLGSAAGGGHHVVTKRRLMLDYSIKGLNPFVPLIKTGSKETYYLKDQVDAYPTALLDFDGNERSSIHLRESDLNVLHILLQQLQSPRLSADVRRAATNAFFTVIDKRRPTWKGIIDGMSEELGALHRSNETQAAAVAGLPKKYSAAEIDKGIDKEGRRVRALAAIDLENEADYTKYVETLKRLVALSREYFDPKKIKIEELIAPGAMGEHNSVYDLQNYVVGLSRSGLTLSADGSLDMARSFTHVNYFDLLQSQTVRNNVQAKLSNRPIDFLAVHIAEDTISDALPPDMRSNADAIWLYGGPEKQALILSRTDADGGLSYRFVPIAGLYQDEDGKIGFRKRELGPGFPLKMFEDPDMAIKPEDRAAWVNAWHTEVEWLRVVHKTMYSDAIVALNEQLDRHPIPFEESATTTDDERLIARFRQRQRTLTEADILIMANNHWNFDVRGFNPGGNHGSFFRVSTNSIFMMAGGSKTGIPRGLAVEDPYDSLSVVPTILALMGKIDDQKRPNAELAEKGYKRFPGRVVKEIVSPSPK
jgi:hypothetical protein